VLLPVRDEEPFLPECLASLSAQTFEDFEVVVVDDASRDGSADLAEEHALRDARFRVLRRAEPGGIVVALETARAAARGRLLAPMDGDDAALPERLAITVEALESEGLDAVGGKIEYFPPENVGAGMRRYEAWINSLVTVEAAHRDLFVECPLPHPAIVARADVVAAAGGYQARGWPQDYDLVLRMWARGARFRNVEQLVLRWREHAARESRVDSVFAIESFVRCKVHYLCATLLRDRPVVVFGAGPVGKSFARELQRHGETVAAFVDVDPRKIGHEVYGAPVVSVENAPRFREAFALGAVAGDEGRARVREAAADAGWKDGADFVAVA
jgi:glycosyltransferase involved in cell wall biosynthesis